MSRYAVRIGSALALAASFCAAAYAPASAADRVPFVFQGKRIVIARLISESGGRAVAIDDPGLQALFQQIGATVTWQPGERYVLVTTAEPVVVSFAIGDRRYDVGPITQTAGFAPFMLDGHAYVPFDELLRALDLAAKPNGGQTILQPQLTSLEVQSDGAGAKLVAHAGMPLDARIVSDKNGKLVIAFDGVGTTLPNARGMGGPVRRMEVRAEGSVTSPRTIVTLDLAPGTTHTPAGTDDQRDFTIGFNGAPAGQTVASAPGPPQAAVPAPSQPQMQTQPEAAQAEAPASPAATALPSPAGPVQVTGVQTQTQNGSTVVHVAVSGDASFDWHRLRPPDNRFWLDVHGARLGIPPQDQNASGAVTAVRVHQENADTVRIALSLSDFETLDVTPDAGGITIAVQSTLADQSSVARSGSGSVGTNAAVAAAATPVPSGSDWKFGPRPAASAYVAPNPRLIVIDPGHGGSDPGSYRGDAIEKDLTLDISKRLRDLLVARGWQVMMTRDTDKDVFAPNDSAHDELQARDDVANNNGARLFVSVHVNAFMNSGPHGATVYYYKPADLALAQALDRRIGSELRIKDDGTVKDKLYVVHHANMPAALVETAFISNPDDRALLQSPDWRQKMAEAIADGIGDYTGPAPAAGSVSGQ